MINRIQFPTLIYNHNNKKFGKVNWDKVKAHANRCPEIVFFFFYLNNLKKFK